MSMKAARYTGKRPACRTPSIRMARKPDFGMSILTTQQAAPFKDGTAFAQVGSETGKGFRDEKGAQRRRFGSRHALFPDQQAEKGVGGDQGQSVIHSDGGRPRRQASRFQKGPHVIHFGNLFVSRFRRFRSLSGLRPPVWFRKIRPERKHGFRPHPEQDCGRSADGQQQLDNIYRFRTTASIIRHEQTFFKTTAG